MRIATKLNMLVGCIVVVIVGIIGTLSVRHETRTIYSEMDERAEALARNLSYNSEYGVVIASKEILSPLLEGILKEKDIVYGRILDKKGNIIVAQSSEQKKGPIKEFTTPIVTRRAVVTREELGIVSETDIGGQEEEIGTVCLGISLASARQKIRGLVGTISTLLIVSGILIFSVSTFALSGLIVRPIGHLTRATERIAEGDLDHKVKISSRDEIGSLAASFNKMTEDLKKSKEEIEEYSKTLEKKVEERTKELQVKVKELDEKGKKLEVSRIAMIHMLKRLDKTSKELASSRTYVENIIRSMIDTLIVVDPDIKIQTINRATEELLGYKENELIGQPVGIIFAEEVLLFKGTRLEKLLKEGSVRDYDMTYLTKDKEKIPVSFSSSVMRKTQMDADKKADKRGEIIGIVGVARDMREIRRLQAQLIQSEKMAAVGTLGAGAAHELNNPLMGATVLLEALQSKTDKKSEVYTTLETVIPELKRCSGVVTDLLTFSRADAMAEETSQIGVDELIGKTLTIIGYQLDKLKITITKDYPSNLPKIWCRPTQIQQVFLNFITNARDAMESTEQKELTIKASLDGDRIRVKFIDTGCGIPNENLPKLFDPFFTTKEPGKGIGLGLSVCRSIIESHKGRIEITSKEGKGTKAAVILPIKEN